MHNLDTLATALYAATDDLLNARPDLAPWRPAVGIAPQLTDAELVTLAMMQAMLGLTYDATASGMPGSTYGTSFPYLAQQPGYNKRQPKDADLIRRISRIGPGHQHLGMERRRVARGLHTRGMRPLARDRLTLRSGRMGAVRLLPQPQPVVLLGPAAGPRRAGSAA